MTKTVPVIALALLCSSPAVADQTHEMVVRICNGIKRTGTEAENKRANEKCMDDLSESMRALKEKSANGGDWTIRRTKSKFKDTEDIYATVSSNSPVTCGILGKSDKITMQIRCKENTTSAMFVTHCHMASGFQGYGRVTYRVDQEKARTINTNVSTDNTALGLWSGGRSIPFVKRLIGKKSLLVRMTPFNESPIEVEFSLSGADKAIKEVREACHW